MKKAVVLGMILLALGTLAYADASIGFGWGRTTFSIASGSSVSGSDIYSGFGGGTWPPAPRENLDIAYSGDNTAFHFTGYLDGTVLSWVGIYGTLKLMPDMFSVLIGRFDNDGWDDFRKTSPHPIRDVNNGNVGRFNGYGVIAVLAPKDSGFEAAVMYKTGDPTGTGSFATISQTSVNTNVGASYTVPNMVKIVAGSTSGTDPVAKPMYVTHRDIFGRVELLMVPNLTLWADVKYDGFDLPTAVSNINAELAGAYDMKPLTIVLAAVYGSNDVLGTKVNAWGVVPEVYYNMGAFTLGLYANVAGSDVANSGIAYTVEPYVKLNDFNTRISFVYSGSTATPAPVSNWRIPVMIDWGF
jgi:hypothetical protein